MNRGVNENSGRHPSDRPTRIPPLPFPCEGNGRNIFRGEENPSVNRHSRFPPVSLFENEIVRGAKVSRVLPSNNERPSYLNGEGSKPRFLRNRGGKRKETIKSAGEGGGEGRREGKRRKGGKKRKVCVATIFPKRREETLKRRESRPLSHGNTAVRNGSIAFFATGRFSKAPLPPPSLLSRFIISRLYHLPLLIIIVEIKDHSQRGCFAIRRYYSPARDLFINSSAPFPSRVISIPIQEISFTA